MADRQILSTEIDGLKFLRKQFSDLSDKSQRAVLRKSLRKAAQPTLKEARKRVQRDEGHLKRSLAISASVKTTKAEARIGARPGKRYNKRSSIVHLVEKGTAHSRAFPFLEPALKATRKDVERTFAKAMRFEIEKIAAKSAAQKVT